MLVRTVMLVRWGPRPHTIWHRHPLDGSSVCVCVCVCVCVVWGWGPPHWWALCVITSPPRVGVCPVPGGRGVLGGARWG